MSINCKRSQPVCLCCEKKRPQVHSLFCDDCWNTNPAGCRRAMNMSECHRNDPKPRIYGEWYQKVNHGA